MFDDLHEIAENSAYLKAMEEPRVEAAIYDRLPEYETLGDWEAALRADGRLTFDAIFHRPAGFYLVQQFLEGEYSAAKGQFVRDVEAFQKLRFESARRKMATMLFDRFVRLRSNSEMADAEDREGARVRSVFAGDHGLDEGTFSRASRANSLCGPASSELSSVGGGGGGGGTAAVETPPKPAPDPAKETDPTPGGPADADKKTGDPAVAGLTRMSSRRSTVASVRPAMPAYAGDVPLAVAPADAKAGDAPPKAADAPPKAADAPPKAADKLAVAAPAASRRRSSGHRRQRSASISINDGVALAPPPQQCARRPSVVSVVSSVSASGGGGGESGGSMLRVGVGNPIGAYGPEVRLCERRVAEGRCEADLFDRLLDQVRRDLEEDAFPRFLRSPQYREFVRTTAAGREPVKKADFAVYRVLGRGGFGSVHACRKIDSGAMYAMKTINKRLVSKKRALHHILGERDVLAAASGRHVTTLKYAFEDKDNLVLIMDLMMGGDLKYHLARRGRFSSSRARFYAAEVLLGLDAMHSQGIVYRDLKLENALLDSEGHVRLSDLGLAVVVNGGRPITGYAGTPGYAAPEVVRREEYGPACDLFSFGVMMYRMISGHKPFKDPPGGGSRDQSVLEVDPPFDTGDFDPDAADLVRGLLEKDAAKRLGAGPRGLDDVKEHRYFRSVDWGLLEAGYVTPPFVPNKCDVNAASLKDIGEFDDDALRSVQLSDRFVKALEGFAYVSEEAIQQELVAALEKKAADKASGKVRLPVSAKKGCCAIQ